MPTGVTVSRSGRIFVNFPRWGDPVDFTVAEIQNGRVVPYPNADINQPDISKQAERFISVQSVVVDPKDRLWVVDTGSIQFSKVSPGGAQACRDRSEDEPRLQENPVSGRGRHSRDLLKRCAIRSRPAARKGLRT